MNLIIPKLIVSEIIHKQSVSHLLVSEYEADFQVEDYRNSGVYGFILRKEEEEIFICTNGDCNDVSFQKIIKTRKPTSEPLESILSKENKDNIKWVKHPELPDNAIDYFSSSRTEAVIFSWKNQFSFKEETETEKGLRKPQIGAVYATLAHWTTSSEAATIVMPTGTGKTETMLALLVSKPCKKLLVVVPSDALRTQIALKFYSLGILRDFNIIGKTALNPCVGILNHRPKTLEEVDDIFDKCNVIISTMSIVAGCSNSIQAKMSFLSTHLFIDEAHHIAANTWSAFKDSFKGKNIVQFTATPFRNDRQPVTGLIVYNFPLIEAQKDGYFKKIIFEPIVEFNPTKADAILAEKAVSQLREDLKQFDHILMARVEKIARAEEVWQYYAHHTDLNPIIVHSNLTNRKSIIEAIKRREHRVIICVNMLGEGFDLPELKVAAIHDNHKSLGITLQFAGRFVRNMINPEKIGNAHFFANIADPGVEESLEELYNEDSNWNSILQIKSSEEIEKPLKHTQLIKGFKNDGKVPLQNLQPKFSVATYKMLVGNEWKPNKFKELFDEALIFDYDINTTENVLMFVVKNEDTVDWSRAKDIVETYFDLYLIYWDKVRNLLYINSSNKNSMFQELAEKLGGDVELIKGDQVFRAFHKVRRVTLYNVGLLYALEGPMRYVMYTGIDVRNGLTPALLATKVKSNVFGVGYSDGKKVTVGCSYKGRIWSRSNGTLSEFKSWCDFQGDKLIDETIVGEEVLQGVLIPEVIKARPSLYPLAIEWSESILSEVENRIDIIFGDVAIPFHEVSLSLMNISDTEPLAFIIESRFERATFQLEINDTPKGYSYMQLEGKQVQIRRGNKKKPVLQWFETEPPRIRFEDTSYIVNNIHIQPNGAIPIVFEIEKIISWDWTGTNIKSESQGFKSLKTDSIQYRVIQEMQNENDYKIIFNDDDSYEAADIIGMRLEADKVIVELYHCKFSLEDKPGHRIKDHYEVCGQAQKSVRWKESIKKLIAHMKIREKTKGKEGLSRFVIGNDKSLVEIEKMVRFKQYEYKIFVVQPGLKKEGVSNEILRLFAATQFYLQETYNLTLTVIAS